VRDYLTAEELEVLLSLHPGGTARFWGAKPSYDFDIDDQTVGDPILFMGDHRVQAVGKVGCKIRKQALAERTRSTSRVDSQGRRALEQGSSAVLPSLQGGPQLAIRKETGDG
jgi:hypothetical protein